MQTFVYEARTIDGTMTSGVIAATNLDDAGHQLGERNLFVVRLGADEFHESLPTGKGRATRSELAWQLSQLAIMVKTGVHLSEALECLARQAKRPRLRSLLQEVSKTVQEGQSLSEAMQQFPDSFPPSLVALIRASEMSGTMSAVLHRASIYLMNEVKIATRIRSALAYPAFMFLACIAVTVFLLTAILPRFAAVFESRKVPLPLPTRVLMSMSDHLVTHWMWWVGVGIGVAVVMWRLALTQTALRWRDHLIVSLPLVSRIFNLHFQSRIFRTFAVLLGAGVSLVSALRVIKEIAPNSRYRDLWTQVEDRIQHGERISGPILASPLFSESIAQMIDSGDRAGKLGYVFEQLADFLEGEYDTAIRAAMQFIEPCMILIMGSGIGFVAASLMLPLFQSSLVMAR